MSPRPDVSEQRKSQILQAAATIVSRKGFSDTRMEDIAEEVGLSKGTLYLYFNSKDDLKLELMRHFFSIDTQELSALETAEGTSTERLMIYLDAGLERLYQFAALSPIINEFYALAARSAEVREFFAETLRQYRASIRRIVQQGIDLGEFNVEDARQVALAFSALFEGMILLSVIDSTEVKVDRDLKPSIALLLKSLKSE